MTTTTEPTLLEKVHALEVTALRLATERTDLLEANRQLQAERDVALQMASQATKDLVRGRNETQARLDLRDAVISSLRISGDAKDAKIQQLSAQLRGLAVADEGGRRRADVERQKPESSALWRRSLKRLGNRKDHP